MGGSQNERWGWFQLLVNKTKCKKKNRILYQKHLISINATDLLLQIIITWMSGARGVCYLTWEFRKIPWEFSGLCKGVGERRKRRDNSVRTRECQYTNRRYAPAWHRVSGVTQFVWMTDSCIHREQWLFEESNQGCFPRLKVWRGTQPCSCTIHLGQVVMVVNIVWNSHSIPCRSWHDQQYCISTPFGGFKHTKKIQRNTLCHFHCLSLQSAPLFLIIPT